MTDLENKRLSPESDKDYGFPFVEVMLLQQRVKPRVQKEEKGSSSIIKSSIEQKPLPRIQEEKAQRKTNHLPVLISMVLLLLVILGAMAYFLYYEPLYNVEVATTPIELTPVDEVEEETLQEPEIEDVEEVELVAPATAENPVVQEANVAKGQLLEMTERSRPPQYFIIVGSLPNVQIAKNEALKYQNSERDVYLIHPFGESRNYRLAIAKFADLQAATNALEKARGEFGESLWVLKY
jgi:hypothetical protein